MTTVFAVIGSNPEDPDELLLQGDDGQRYVWSNPDSEPSPCNDDSEKNWQIDASVDDETLFL